MTEKFVVPEPSEAACHQAHDKAGYRKMGPSQWGYGSGPNGDVNFDAVLSAAYAVDVPAIVKAEVERALSFFEIDCSDYLATRFPEAAPETSNTHGTKGVRESGSAPTPFVGHPSVTPQPSAAPKLWGPIPYTPTDESRSFVDEAPEIVRKMNERLGVTSSAEPRVADLPATNLTSGAVSAEYVCVEELMAIWCGNGHQMETVPITDGGWVFRTCRECGSVARYAKRVPTPPVTPSAIETPFGVEPPVMTTKRIETTVSEDSLRRVQPSAEPVGEFHHQSHPTKPGYVWTRREGWIHITTGEPIVTPSAGEREPEFRCQNGCGFQGAAASKCANCPNPFHARKHWRRPCGCLYYEVCEKCKPTPNEGERCKVCGGTGELRVIGPEQNRTIACGCRVPTPSAGETKPNCACGDRGKWGEHSPEKCVWDNGNKFYPPNTNVAVGARPEDPNQCDYRNGLGQCVLPRGHEMPHMGEEDFKPRCTACACEGCRDGRRILGEMLVTPAERDFLRALAEERLNPVSVHGARSGAFEAMERANAAARRVIGE